MSVARIVGLLFALLTAVCADVSGVPPSGPAQTGATQDGAAAVDPGARPAMLPTTFATGQSLTKIDSPSANTSAPAPIKRLRTKESAAPALEKQQASPPLDLVSLQNLLRETKSISFFSKIALRNQIDGLLNQFRAYYQGRSRITLAELRQRYDLLLLRVLSLLQDRDQSLATAIGASRESIWGILSDREKFATI